MNSQQATMNGNPNTSANAPQNARRRATLGAVAAGLAAYFLAPASHASSISADAAWSRLGAAKWVRDGDEKASRVVYVITDPSCRWCHRLWESSRPWVLAGKVQIRHVLVGFIRPDSAGKAASILNAQDPAAAIEQNELAFDRGGIVAAPEIDEAVKRILESNRQMMRELGFNGTPAIIYKNAAGEVEKIAGFPKSDRLRLVMGDL